MKTLLPSEPGPARRSSAGAGHRLQPLENSLVQTLIGMCYSLPIWFVVRPQRYFDAEDFDTTRRLQAVADEVATECEAFVESTPMLAVQEADPTQRRLNHDRRWKMLVLRVYGRDVPVNMDELPILRDFLHENPDLVSATVSVLEPGKRIMLHPGPMKGLIRVQLGVKVPSSGRCEIHVGGKARQWRRGEILMFDDSYPHRVVNDTTETRTVIIFDLVRPLPWPWLQRVNGAMIRWFGRRRRADDTISLAEEWTRSRRR